MAFTEDTWGIFGWSVDVPIFKFCFWIHGKELDNRKS